MMCGVRMLAVALLGTGCADGDASLPNPPSVGSLDSPKPGTSVSSQFVVAGWAADESGVAQVRLVIDDTVIAKPRLTVPRADVDQAFPSLLREPHGFVAVVDVGDRTGPCLIQEEVLDRHGAVSRVAHVRVVIEP